MKASKFKYYVREILTPSLIQFGPPRTGSTLLWNTLRLVQPNQKVLKQHSLSRFQKSRFCRSQIVASVRNPLDSISSSIQRYEKTPTLALIDEHLNKFERNGIWDLLELKINSRALILKYEDFYNNWQYIFCQIENFLEFQISEKLKDRCIREYSIDEVERKARSLGSFSNYNKADHIHGKHISKFRGQVGYGSKYLSNQMIDRIYEKLRPIFDEFQYEYPKQVEQDSGGNS